jgi:hypothetical protein
MRDDKEGDAISYSFALLASAGRTRSLRLEKAKALAMDDPSDLAVIEMFLRRCAHMSLPRK